jgi:hypothetical protein
METCGSPPWAEFAASRLVANSHSSRCLQTLVLGQLVSGPNGNMWFLWTGASDGAGFITPDGTVQLVNSLPSADAAQITDSSGVFDELLDCLGSDGNFWALTGGSSGYLLNRVTPAGDVTSFALPAIQGNSAYCTVLAGPDGNLWVSSFDRDLPAVRLTVVNTSGAALGEFASPIQGGSARLSPREVIFGADGNLYGMAVQDGPDFQSIDRLLLPVAGPVSQLSVTPSSTQVAAGVPFSITVRALDPSGAVDANYLGTVSFSSSAPSNATQLPPAYTFTASDQGVHTFTGVTLTQSGVQSISATDIAACARGFTDVAVVSGPATALRLSEGSSGVEILGMSTSYQVSAVDAWGNPVPIYTGTIHFTSIDPAAQLPADYTFTAADGGVHEFIVVMGTMGSQNVSITDGTLSAQIGVTVVTPPVEPLPRLVLTAPDLPHAGTPFVLGVTAEDQNGNIVPFYETIDFSSTDPEAVLPTSYQFQAPDAGVHTFSGLVLNSTGQQMIHVTDSRLGISASITLGVLPAPFSPPPPPAINEFTLWNVNGPMFSGITTGSDGAVYGTDAYGNLVRATTTGSSAVIPLGQGPIDTLWRPATGRNGDLYVPEGDAGISIYDPQSGALSHLSVPAEDLTMGSDGNMWLVHTQSTSNMHSSVISRLTPEGDVTNFPMGSEIPYDLTAGPDGKMWFKYTTGDLVGGIGRITPQGVISTFPMLSFDGFGNLTEGIRNLAFDRNGNLWFISMKRMLPTSANGVPDTTLVVDRVDPSGNLTEFPCPSQAVERVDQELVLGPDGNLWAFESGEVSGAGGAIWPENPMILRISPDGAVTQVPISSPDGGRFVLLDATVGSDGNIWFVGETHTGNGGTFVVQVVLPTEGPPASLLVASVDTTVTAGSAFAITVRAVDANGMQIIGYRGTVHFFSSDQAAGLPADYTFTAGDQGVHTFIGIELDTAGTQTLTVSDSGDGISGTISLTVLPGPAAAFDVQAAATGVDNLPLTITVIAKDAFGNRATGFGGTVHFSSSDPSAGLPADFTFTSADNGIHTFTVALKTLGSQSISVSDSPDNLTSQSVPIAVDIGSFGVAAPGSVQAGQSFTVTVSALDGAKGIVSAYVGTIHFSSSDQQAGLPADYQFTAADHGVHTFQGVFLGTSGSEPIVIREKNGAAIGSSSAMVTPGPLAALASIASLSAIAGSPFSLTVAAFDRFHNALTDYSGTVNIATGDPKGIVPGVYKFQASDQGVHSFAGIVLETAGSQKLTVSDANASVSNQTGVQVSPAAASRYTISVPAHAHVGTNMGITITAFDRYGNKATNYFGALHFASSDLHAGLPANYSFGPLDQGSHTFQVTFHDVGNQSLSVSDLNNSSLQATSPKILVTANDWVTGADAGGGPEVKLFDATTGKARLDFMAYSPYFTGGVRIGLGDTYGTGVPDIITVPGPTGGPDVRVFDGTTGRKMFEFMAFDPHFTGGLFVTVADFNGDGYADIAIGADAGGGPQVKIFSGKGIASGSVQVLASFYAYSPFFNGGVRLASGDVNGDGTPELIAAPGPGGGPDIRVFDGAHLNQATSHSDIIREFMAYSPFFTGGVYLTAGDVNGDGKTDIITGAGAGGGPQVSVFNGLHDSPLKSFMAYSPYFNGGVRVGYALDADGHGDILTAAGTGGGPHVQVLNGLSLTAMDSFYAYNPAFNGGVFIGGE